MEQHELSPKPFQAADRLTPWSSRIRRVVCAPSDERIAIPAVVRRATGRLSEQEGFRNGDLVTVAGYELAGNTIKIATQRAKYFDYVRASYFFRGNQLDNPIRPLAVSAFLLTASNEVIVERRRGVAEYEGKFHVLGGALRSGEQPSAGMRRMLQKKLGFAPKSFSMEPTGATIEHIQGVFEIFYLVRLRAGEERQFRARMGCTRELHFISLCPPALELFFMQHDLSEWSPSGPYNLLYGLDRLDARTVDQLQAAQAFMERQFRAKPYMHLHPYERYAPSVRA